MPDYFLKRGSGVYRRQVEFGGPAELTCESLGIRGKIYWDKQLIGEAKAAFACDTFRFDAGAEGTHELIIAVNNEFDDSDSSLFRRNYDFYAYGGIYRKVTLTAAEDFYAEELKIIPQNITTGDVEISLKLCGNTAKKSGDPPHNDTPFSSFARISIQGVSYGDFYGAQQKSGKHNRKLVLLLFHQ